MLVLVPCLSYARTSHNLERCSHVITRISFIPDRPQRIQQYVNREWVQVPIPGSRDDPSGPRPAKSASATARPASS
jgi:hypothetical protein